MKRIFISPTYGPMTFRDMMDDIAGFVGSESGRYRFIVGCDSQARQEGVRFVSAIVVHRVGKFGRYFWARELVPGIAKMSFKERIFEETSRSIELGNKIMGYIDEKRYRIIRNKKQMEIHLDVGYNGRTSEIINAVIGMVKAYGYTHCVKPDSWGACSVADRYSK
ncbi:MAG: ribonuclease H-like YkuK family protein [Synergistales bacterium]|nr:ribonuclease H-like YkuK family protein [Synergistales bacterium]